MVRNPAWEAGLRRFCAAGGVCLRRLGGGGGADAAEAGRLGDAERVVELALAVGELARLGEVAVCRSEVALADLAELGADRAPGLAAAGLGEPDEHEQIGR